MQRGWRSTGTKAVNKAPSPLAAADLGAAAMGPECQVAVGRKTAAMVDPSRNRNQVRGEFILPPPCGWAAAESAYRWPQIRRCKWRERRSPPRKPCDAHELCPPPPKLQPPARRNFRKKSGQRCRARVP